LAEVVSVAAVAVVDGLVAADHSAAAAQVEAGK